MPTHETLRDATQNRLSSLGLTVINPEADESDTACDADTPTEARSHPDLLVTSPPSVSTELCPPAARFFASDDIAVEVEVETVLKPSHTIKRLSKAANENRRCLFIVEDGRPDHNPSFYAELVERTLTDPACRTSDREERYTYYNDTAKLRLRNDGIALIDVPPTRATRWHDAADDQDDLVLPLADDRTCHISRSALVEGDGVQPDAFPYHYTYSFEDEEFAIHDRDGNCLKACATTRAMQRDGYWPVYRPLLPERAFLDDIPETDEWLVLIRDRETGRFHAYSDGAYEPLTA